MEEFNKKIDAGEIINLDDILKLKMKNIRALLRQRDLKVPVCKRDAA